VQAARELAADGFEVFPHCNDELITCQRFLGASCRIPIPSDAPIGCSQGLLKPSAPRRPR